MIWWFQHLGGLSKNRKIPKGIPVFSIKNLFFHTVTCYFYLYFGFLHNGKKKNRKAIFMCNTSNLGHEVTCLIQKMTIAFCLLEGHCTLLHPQCIVSHTETGHWAWGTDANLKLLNLPSESWSLHLLKRLNYKFLKSVKNTWHQWVHKCKTH